MKYMFLMDNIYITRLPLSLLPPPPPLSLLSLLSLPPSLPPLHPTHARTSLTHLLVLAEDVDMEVGVAREDGDGVRVALQKRTVVRRGL
jgi:hypothetical protein